jgi:hypothetical protein
MKKVDKTQMNSESDPCAVGKWETAFGVSIAKRLMHLLD